MKNIFKKTLVLAVVTAFVTTLSTSAFADDTHVINLAGKQRMLSQKISKEVLLVALDVNKDENLKNVKETGLLFEKTLNGLLNGDESLNLPGTKKPQIVKALKDVEGLWVEFSIAVNNVSTNGTATSDDVTKVAELNLPLLKAMDTAVKFYEASASSKGTNAALAIAVNLAGKQRMLTQKMSKEFLLVAYGRDAVENRKNLAATTALFDRTLKGLIAGDTELGLSPAPSDEIVTQLKKVQEMWNALSGTLNEVANGGAVTDDSKKKVADANLPLLNEMNAAVQLFEKI